MFDPDMALVFEKWGCRTCSCNCHWLLSSMLLTITIMFDWFLNECENNAMNSFGNIVANAWQARPPMQINWMFYRLLKRWIFWDSLIGLIAWIKVYAVTLRLRLAGVEVWGIRLRRDRCSFTLIDFSIMFEPASGTTPDKNFDSWVSLVNQLWGPLL